MLPILEKLIPEGLRYGANYVVEFDPSSLWYETSLTMTAQAVKSGIRTEYHIFQHVPAEVREALTKLGLDIKKSEDEGIFRILDTYTVTTGLGRPEDRGKSYESMSFNLSDWSIAVARVVKEGASQEEKRWLHIDDNTSVLNQYSDEKTFIDIWRTRAIPYARARELAMIHSHVIGVASNAFYRQFEQLCDGTLDFKSEEIADQIGHYARVRSLRGQAVDSRWRRLRLLDNGEVVYTD